MRKFRLETGGWRLEGWLNSLLQQINSHRFTQIFTDTARKTSVSIGADPWLKLLQTSSTTRGIRQATSKDTLACAF